jgi:hypothetical protein
MATGYGLDDRGVGVRVSVGSRIFSMSSIPILKPAQSPIQWVPVALSPVLSDRAVKLTTHLHLVPSRNVDLYIHSAIRLQGVVPNYVKHGNILKKHSHLFRKSCLFSPTFWLSFTCLLVIWFYEYTSECSQLHVCRASYRVVLAPSCRFRTFPMYHAVGCLICMRKLYFSVYNCDDSVEQ